MSDDDDIKQWDEHVEPTLRPIKAGWSAHGIGWAVHGTTREEAIQKYLAAERLHREMQERGRQQTKKGGEAG